MMVPQLFCQVSVCSLAFRNFHSDNMLRYEASHSSPQLPPVSGASWLFPTQSRSIKSAPVNVRFSRNQSIAEQKEASLLSCSAQAAGTMSSNFMVALRGLSCCASGRMASFKGICPATPLKIQVPVGRVGMDSSVILSI